MSVGANYETSSTYVGGFIKALRDLELFTPELEGLFGEPQRQMAHAPYSRAWWSGSDSEVIVRAVISVYGAETLEEIGFRTARNNVGPVIAPLISVIGAIFGLRPSSLYERISDLSITSVRGVVLAWTSAGARSGVLRITYPPRLGGAIVEPLWRGACRFIFETARTKGEFVSSVVDGSVVLLSMRW